MERRCPECNNAIIGNDNFCYKCGERLDLRTPPKQKQRKYLGVLSLIFACIGLVFSYFYIGIIPCLSAYVLSLIALSQKNSSKKTAIIGLVISVIGTFCFITTVIIDFNKNNNGFEQPTIAINDEIETTTETIQQVSKEQITSAEYVTEEETTTVHVHNWNRVCGNTSICIDCGEDDGIILTHTTELGICERCNQEIRKQSPITIINMTWEKDYLGGVQWIFKIRNNTDKQIKYVTLQWSCYNAVGDFVYDDIDGDNYVRVKYTGPLDAYNTTNYIQNSTKFYDSSFNNSIINEIIVEYMDGTTEKVTKYHDNISE